ncbi:unnamed protein product, partial [Anisakis simplex]|uniref:EB domain-containing protein n=1 Tax=Anisakis simplex TaxID=6269 RepID=A0A0M3KJB2_ANISI
GTGNVCSTDYQCLGGQKCHSEVCECDGNEVILGGRCVKNDGFCLQGEQGQMILLEDALNRMEIARIIKFSFKIVAITFQNLARTANLTPSVSVDPTA